MIECLLLVLSRRLLSTSWRDMRRVAEESLVTRAVSQASSNGAKFT